MSVVQQLLCRHQYEPTSVHEEGTLVKKCRKCGRRVEEQLSAETTA